MATSSLRSLIETTKRTIQGAASAALFSLWIGGKPVPAGRPRVSKWGTYYPKSYTTWIKASTAAVAALEAFPSDRPIALIVEVLCPRPKKTDHVAPMGDVDNFAKGPMDLITKLGKAWLDDRQIVFLATAKRWVEDGEEPGFLLTWSEIDEPTGETHGT